MTLAAKTGPDAAPAPGDDLAILYHYPHSFCSEIIRLALVEKRLEWRGRVVDIGPAHENYQPWYVGLNQAAVVPTLKDGEDIVCGTRAILDHIEATHTDQPLMPADAAKTSEAEAWVAQGLDFPDRELAFVSARAFSPLLWRWDMPRRRRLLNAHRRGHPDLAHAYDQKIADLDQWRAAVETPGAKAEQVGRATEMLDALEAQLEDGREWIVGDYSLADVVWTVVLARLDFFNLQNHFDASIRPRVASYYERAATRPSFAAAPVYTEWDPMVTMPSLIVVASPWLLGLAIITGFLIWTLI